MVLASTLPDVLARWAEIDPAAPAILAPGRETLTREGLREQIRRTAASLTERGHGTGTRVAIAMPDGPECAVALLGVSAIATAVPLNPMADEESLRAALTSVEARALIVAKDDRSRAAKVARRLGLSLMSVTSRTEQPAGTIELDNDRGQSRAAYPTPLPCTDALVLQSSGTTGRPKLVALTHETLVRRASARARFLGLASRDRCLSVTPLHTPAGTRRNLLVPLVVGGSVVCTSGFDAAAFFHWLEETRATFFPASATVHSAVADWMREERRPLRHSLRLIVSGAVGVQPEVRSQLEEAFGVPVIQGYAMLEADVVAHESLDSDRRSASVGRPVDREIAILGEDGEWRGPLEAGEILVRGPDLFTGYEGDPQATQLAFHGDWYKTGDLGYVDSDGFLYVTGRLKELINRGGDKVSPGLVDRVALRHPAIADAATFGVPHPTLGEDVHIAVVVREGMTLGTAEVREFLGTSLEARVMPSRIVIVDSIPKNAAGKVQRSKLPEATPRGAYVSFTASDDEREIAKLFAQVLGVERISLHDDFFALGGDSLRAVRLAQRASEMLSRSVSPLVVFENPTVRGLARALQRADACKSSITGTCGIAPGIDVAQDRDRHEAER